jgi:hypothetical protein
MVLLRKMIGGATETKSPGSIDLWALPVRHSLRIYFQSDHARRHLPSCVYSHLLNIASAFQLSARRCTRAVRSAFVYSTSNGRSATAATATTVLARSRGRPRGVERRKRCRTKETILVFSNEWITTLECAILNGLRAQLFDAFQPSQLRRDKRRYHAVTT